MLFFCFSFSAWLEQFFSVLSWTFLQHDGWALGYTLVIYSGQSDYIIPFKLFRISCNSGLILPYFVKLTIIISVLRLIDDEHPSANYCCVVMNLYKVLLDDIDT